MSIRQNVHSGKYSFWKIGFRENVHSAKCTFWLVYVQGNVHSGQCPFGKVFFGEMSFLEGVFLEDVLDPFKRGSGDNGGGGGGRGISYKC